MPTTLTNVHEDTARIARQPEVDILDFVVATDWDGCPVLADDAPHVCENDPLVELDPHTPVAIFDHNGAYLCAATAGWVARQSGLARVGDRTFRQV